MVQYHGRLENYSQFLLWYLFTQICYDNFGNFELLNQEIQSSKLSNIAEENFKLLNTGLMHTYPFDLFH